MFYLTIAVAYLLAPSGRRKVQNNFCIPGSVANGRDMFGPRETHNDRLQHLASFITKNMTTAHATTPTSLSIPARVLVVFALANLALSVVLPIAYTFRARWPSLPEVDMPFGLSLLAKHYEGQLLHLGVIEKDAKAFGFLIEIACALNAAYLCFRIGMQGLIRVYRITKDLFGLSAAFMVLGVLVLCFGINNGQSMVSISVQKPLQYSLCVISIYMCVATVGAADLIFQYIGLKAIRKVR